MRVLMGFRWLRTRKLEVPVEGRIYLQCLMIEHNLLKKICASNVKVKVVSLDFTEAYHGSEGITALILNLDTRWRR
jgi:hypothetical protein